MSHVAPFSRLDLRKLTRVPDDVLSFWLKRGLVRSATADAGERRHRRFDRDQVRIVAFLGAARDAGMNIRGLEALSQIAQQAATAYRHVAPPQQYALEVADLAGDYGADWRPPAFMTAEDEEAVRQAAERLPVELISSYRLGVSFDPESFVKPDPWFVYRDALDGVWRIQARDNAPDVPGVRFAIMFAMNQIFDIDWAQVAK